MILATMLPPWLLAALCVGIGANLSAQAVLWWTSRRRRNGRPGRP
jgi:hypothetical protein